MIQSETRLKVADNSGGRVMECVKVLGSSRRRYARVGDLITASIIKSIPSSDIEEGEVVQAVVVRTRKEKRRPDGSYIKFDDNAGVILDGNGLPVGTRIFGPIARELRNENYMRIISLAPEVV